MFARAVLTAAAFFLAASAAHAVVVTYDTEAEFLNALDAAGLTAVHESFDGPAWDGDDAVFGVSAPLVPADLNGDGIVGGPDLALMLAAWGVGAGPADLDGDGAVGGSDLAILLAAWG